MRELIEKKIQDARGEMGDEWGPMSDRNGETVDLKTMDLTLMSDEELLDLYDTFYGFIG